MSGLIILDEGPHFAVLDKPAGMTVVGGRGVPRPTLLDLAVERWPDARPVHRLDKPTTGCCVVAKTAFGQQALSDAFRRHIVDKRYVAVVVGVPPWDKLDIDARLSRVDDPDIKVHGRKTAAIQTVDEKEGQRALTRARVLARGDGVALIEARLETGRMHQIRCHLAHVGFPLVGDVLYGAQLAFLDANKESAKAQQEIALHALCLSVPKPEGGGRSFATARLPWPWLPWLQARKVDVTVVDELRARFVKPAETQPAKKATPQKQEQKRGPPRSRLGAGTSRSAGGRRGGRRDR